MPAPCRHGSRWPPACAGVALDDAGQARMRRGAAAGEGALRPACTGGMPSSNDQAAHDNLRGSVVCGRAARRIGPKIATVQLRKHQVHSMVGRFSMRIQKSLPYKLG